MIAGINKQLRSTNKTYRLGKKENYYRNSDYRKRNYAAQISHYSGSKRNH